MNLLELMIGSTLLAMAAGSSLQLWALAGAAAVVQERHQERMEQAEVVLARAETALRRLPPGSGDCGTATSRVWQLLDAEPLAPGVERQLETSATGDGVVLRLVVAGAAEPRQRLYVPAVLGLCATAQGGGGGTL